MFHFLFHNHALLTLIDKFYLLQKKESQRKLHESPLTYNEAPMRGAEWDKRMWADRGDEIVDGIAARVGGKRE